MNRKGVSLVAAAALFLLSLLPPSALAQDETAGQEQVSIAQYTLALPLQGETPEQAMEDSRVGLTLQPE
jgi:predicted outer membrane protein